MFVAQNGVCVCVTFAQYGGGWGQGGMALQLSPALGELCRPHLSQPLEQPQDPDLEGLLQPASNRASGSPGSEA